MGFLIGSVKKIILLLIFLLILWTVFYFYYLNITKTLFYQFKENILTQDTKSLKVILDDRLKQTYLTKVGIDVLSKELKNKKLEKISIKGFNLSKKIIFSKIYLFDRIIDFDIVHKNKRWIINQVNISE